MDRRNDYMFNSMYFHHSDTMASSEVVFSLVYVLISACLVAPPTEFVSAGLTIQNVLDNILGSEDLNFCYYHVRRTSATVFFHSLLPLGYYVGMAFFAPQLELVVPWQASYYWFLYWTVSLIFPVASCLLIYYWSQSKWTNHPIAKTLQAHAPTGSNWHSVASSINIEFRRIDKFTTGIPGRRMFVTDSWVLKTSTYSVHVAHQSDVHLSLTDSQEHALSHESVTGVQYLTITVSSVNDYVKPFTIRLNALEYGDLREKLQAPVRNARNIVIQQSLNDRFLEAFRQQVAQNQVYRKPHDVELEPCIGCMQKPSNIKLQKLCEADNCVQCYCRPMWCLECMGKWFASRQDQGDPGVWLTGQSPCPTCRSVFCILDVSTVV